MKKITKGIMVMSVAIPTLALTQTADKVEALTKKEVTSYSLNVRQDPNANAKVVDWLKQGQVIDILNDGNGWDRVQLSNGKTGYVNDKFLKTISTGEEHRTVTAYWLTMRKGPSADTTAIDYLKQGTNVNIISYSGNWAQVQVNGKKGYVNSSFLSKSSSNTSSSSNNSSSSESRTVTAYWLTMRNAPNASAKDIDYLKQGTAVNVHSYQGDWAYVTANGHNGYVNSKYLSKGTSNPSTPQTENPQIETPSTIKTTKYVNSPDGLNIRSGRGVQYNAITNMPYGSTVQVSNVVGNWGYVEFGNVKGYANVGYLTNSKPSENNNNSNNNTSNPAPTGSLKGKLLVVDPGHGGPYGGSVGVANEEQVNLAISLKVKSKLESMGARVVMTRTANVPCTYAGYNQDLTCRPALATKLGADAFISIHANSGGPSATGTETFWYNANRGDKKLATLILDELVKETGLNKRRVDSADFAVLRNSTVPATLVETGFVTNPYDASKLTSPAHQEKFAKAISEGIQKYFQ
ncbi:N-acetylmuramoyl-L-alanine amidase [Bacillus toyonensis]|uniref:N-acetylmuramoyl-L-alanine amidase n=1 Tax=Bacillus toyonensis TaxID=155322 RepID=UPI002E22105D|nr:N-acetylmuramoyl-L-alanine amidase [Bacillus toyonensis]MED2737833.1 N-acetylmuramoyl-L-alanine amidase [Bacillus toyonensis]